MANQNLALPREDLVEYVNTMLNEGTPFKQIARSLQIADPRQLKRRLWGTSSRSIIILQLQRCLTPSRVPFLLENMEQIGASGM